MNKGVHRRLRAFSSALIMMMIFYLLAISLWVTTGVFFYLVNFFIIGTCISFGMGLWPILSKSRKDRARQLSQVLVGGYLFFGLGFGLIYIFFGVIVPENMQIEGFFFWLFAGSSAAAVLHYVIAKIVGPFIFNRGWCGWACWTAAVLDFLPWKRSNGRLLGRWEYMRYASFCLSLTIVLFCIFLLGINLDSNFGIIDLAGKYSGAVKTYRMLWQIPEFLWFLVGNLFYYNLAILLAFVLKDNRAFCKYLCPITVFLKAGAKVSLLKIRGDPKKCIECGACEKICPMDIRITQYIKYDQRVNSSECIFCFKCLNVCPEKALSITKSMDLGKHEWLSTRNK